MYKLVNLLLPLLEEKYYDSVTTGENVKVKIEGEFINTDGEVEFKLSKDKKKYNIDTKDRRI